MARRSRSWGEWLLVLAALAVGVQVGKAVARWIQQHPVVAGLGLTGLLALVIAGLVSAELARQRAAARQMELERNIGSTDGVSGPEFERWFARLLGRSGFTGIRVCGGAGDLGADVIATSPLGERVVFQCKRHTRNVPDRYVQQFAGTCRAIHRADIAAIVTTAGFTQPAWALARRLDIVLVDRKALAAWATDGTPPRGFGGGRSAAA